MSGEEKFSEILSNTCVKIDILSERFDKHMNDLYSKIDQLKDSYSELKLDVSQKIGALKLDSVKENASTNIRIASISGSVAIIISIVLIFIEKMINI